MRRPGAWARARLFPAVPVGAGGWGGGAGSNPSPLSGGGRGDHPPCLGGWGPGPPQLAGPWGGFGGGGVALPPPCSPSGWRPAVPYPGPPLVGGAVPLGVRPRSGSRGRPGAGGGEGRPVDRSPGPPSDLKPPSALPERAVVMQGSRGARPPNRPGAPPCAAPRLGPRAAPARWCGLALRPRPLREQAAGGAGARGVQVQPHPPPPPASRSLLGEGGRPLGSKGGRRVAPVALKLGGESGGGGAPPPSVPPPGWASACHPLSPACPPGVSSCCGGCRAAAGVGRGPVGRQRVSAAGGGGGGGNPPALIRAPVFPGPASEGAAPFAPSWAPPVRRRPAAGRACGRLPGPRCPRSPGAAASSGGVRGHRLFGLLRSALGPEGEGGGEWGGASGPLEPPPDGRGGAAWRSRARGPAVGWGVALLPLPPLPRVGPSCRPSLGPLVPPAAVARRWPAGGGREG